MKDTFITRCRFGFPRQERDEVTLLTVEECMKLSHRKMYNLPRSKVETRINNYNPLILMLWKANMDRRVFSGNCPVRHWLRDQGGEEQHAGPLAGGLLSLLRIQQAVLVRLALQGVRSLRGQRSPSRRPPVWQVPDRQVDRRVAATAEEKETPPSLQARGNEGEQSQFHGHI